MFPQPAMMMIGGAPPYIAPGSQTYTASDTWVCPAGVTLVAIVCVQQGQNGNFEDTGGAGGDLRWKNQIPTTPGASYAVAVGVTGGAHSSVASLLSSATALGSGVGGGNGGGASASGGGGAGGYTGNGGISRFGDVSGSGGGGGGSVTGKGGGVGLLGEGPSGTNVSPGLPGDPGSGGVAELYGGGGTSGTPGGQGAVRIIWGTGRAFPSTMTGEI